MVHTFARAPLSKRFASVPSSPARDLLTLGERVEMISFAGGLPAPETFDVVGLREAIDSLPLDAGVLQYSASEGHAGLRTRLARRYENNGLPTTDSDILVTTGSQQALMLLATTLITPGDVALVTRPTYIGAIQALGVAGARLVEVGPGEDGIDLDELDRIAAEVRPVVLYLTPTYQNPTGQTLPTETRRRLVDLAQRHGFRIIEDEPYGYLRYSGEPVPSIASFDAADPEERVVLSMGSFSKVLAPALRVGWMRVPPDVRPTVIIAKQAADLHTSTLTQEIVARYLASGRLEPTLASTRATYRTRRDAMLQALPSVLPAGSIWTTPEGGMFVWITLPARYDTVKLLDSAVRRGVAFSPGVPFYVTNPERHMLRLSFTSHSPEQIHNGLDRLGTVLAAA